ncbi:hypothetical protein D0Z00_004116 [Geotrichum galactomycetum]|uniref:Uncharacterized protein n=1 Tax=Geotrichum galactomycetum TaxID=27317 RepID=A0ACB6UZH3_9ASCO|nr:hypothetical protein D0Z00_004116 [Geotrichum candidum]
MQSMIPPPQQQLQQLQQPRFSNNPSGGPQLQQPQQQHPQQQQQQQQQQQPQQHQQQQPQQQQQPPQQQQPQPPPQQRRLPFTQHNNPNMPQYPWSERTISNASPFPRYGHAANYIAAREGEVFVMGGLKGSNVFGDLWVIETDTLTGYLLDTDGCPSPRVGHASLTLGNAFIVFGGDTKIEETDILDDNLYLLNTSSLKWTVAPPTGPRPSGRYGHTISTIGSVLYVFGGQLDDYFFDDLICYDLNTLQSENSHWTFIKPNSRSPPPRTNHTVITYQDKLYLFGGTDGKLWYSDTWVYDPLANSWSSLECTGFVPAPCEGHSATIIGDIMYIFGGRSAGGKDLGTLSALKISARKWFSFQNMGPAPSPRSGHSMTAFGGHKILIMGGESPELDPENPNAYVNEEESTNVVYVLDTSRISYPPSANDPPSEKSIEDRSVQQQVPQQQMQQQKIPISYTKDTMQNTMGLTAPIGATAAAAAGADAVNETSPLSHAANETNVSAPAANETRPLSYSANETNASAPTDSKTEKDLKSRIESVDSEMTPGFGYERVNVGDVNENTEVNSVSDEADGIQAPLRESTRDLQAENTIAASSPGVASESTFDSDNIVVRKNSNRSVTDDESKKPAIISNGSVDNLNQALEQLKASNSWYESELSAAREKGYIPSTRPPVDVLQLRRVSQRITQDTDGSLSERAILLEALSDLKSELQGVQDNVKNQAEQASAKIAEAEADRDDAFERIKLLEAQLKAAQNGSTPSLVTGGSTPALAVGALTSRNIQTRSISAVNTEEENSAIVELDKVKSDNMNLEQQLRTFSDKSILAQHEATRYKTQFEELQARHALLEDTTNDHVTSLAALTAALTAAQVTSSGYLSTLNGKDTEVLALQEEIKTLKAELATTQHELLVSNNQLQEHKTLLSKATEQGTASSAALTSGVERIVALWTASTAFNKAKRRIRRERATREIGAESADTEEVLSDEEADQEEEEDAEVVQLRQQVKDISGLYETHQKAANEATHGLSDALQEIHSLKQELLASQKAQAKLEQALELSRTDFETQKKDLEAYQIQLNDNKKSLDVFAEEAKLKSNESEGVVETLKKELDELHERHTFLENEYETTMQYVRNSDKALTKTREELSKHKDNTIKLQSEIDELRLRLQDQEENEDNVSVTSSNNGGSGVRSRTDHRVGTPPAKYNSRQIELQLRDLRAQIIILQEERDELRANTIEIKKKLITHTEDLKDSQAMIEQLEQENSQLIKRLNDAEAKNESSQSINTYSGSNSHLDRTIDDISSELDQIRNNRERVSGILNGP